MPSLDEIIKGKDITSHYLNPHQVTYKLYRCGDPIKKNQNVYAVRYDQGKPVDYVHMWASHNKEIKEHKETQVLSESHLRKIGRGRFGTVYEKNEKAIKHLPRSRNLINKAVSHKRNLILLDQKFRLHQEEVDQYFVMGLFRNKDGPGEEMINIFIMPKVEKVDNPLANLTVRKHIDEFVCALKKVNDMGLAIPDYCGDDADIEETGFQNDYYTADGIRVFDLDEGFIELQTIDNTKELAVYKDQWLLVYNYKLNSENKEKWLNTLRTWYETHPGQALSDNPEELLLLHTKNSILLPETIVAMLTKPGGSSLLSRTTADDESKVPAMGPTTGKNAPLKNKAKAQISKSSFWWHAMGFGCCSDDSATLDQQPSSIKKIE